MPKYRLLGVECPLCVEAQPLLTCHRLVDPLSMLNVPRPPSKASV